MPDIFNWFTGLTREHAKELTGMNLDRFAVGLPDPQGAPVVNYCDGCGDEIYPGEVHQDTDTDKIYCEDFCAPVGAELMRVEINREGEVTA